jgi:plastocyanin
MIRAFTAAGAMALAALAAAAVGFGGTSSTPSTVRATVGPGFTIGLTKGRARVKSLRAGTYRFVVSDRSAEHNFVLQRGSAVKQLTSVAFVGTKTVTVKLTRGAWAYFCAPHASAMRGRFGVGSATVLAAVKASAPPAPVVDDHGGHGEAEPGDDHGGGHEPEPGDDRGHGGDD